MQLGGQHRNIAAHAPTGIPCAKELRHGCRPHMVTVPGNCALAESSSAAAKLRVNTLTCA